MAKLHDGEKMKGLGLEIPIFMLLFTLSMIIMVFLPWTNNMKKIGSVIRYYALERNGTEYLMYFNTRPMLDSGKQSTLELDELLGIYSYGANHVLLSQVKGFIPKWGEIYIDYGNVSGKINLKTAVEKALPPPGKYDSCTPPSLLPIGKKNRHFVNRIFYPENISKFTSLTWDNYLKYPSDLGACAGGNYLFKEEMDIPTPDYELSVRYVLIFDYVNKSDIPKGINVVTLGG